MSLRYKFDEMTMKTRTSSKAGDEKALTKILQVRILWVVLSKVRDDFLRLWLPLSTSLLSILRCTIPIIRRALDRFCTFPALAYDFESRSRIPIADKHASNAGADETYMHDFPSEPVQRFACQAHTGHKEAECLLETYANAPDEP